MRTRRTPAPPIGERVHSVQQSHFARGMKVMALDFYYGSGSPYAWRVWLALEHKQVPYELKLMSFDAGDLEKPAFLAINQRHKRFMRSFERISATAKSAKIM